MKKNLYPILCLLLFTINIYGISVQTIPNPKTADAHSYVSNPDGILTRETEWELNNILNRLEQENSAEVAVVAVNTIGDNDIKVFATELLEYWGIGKAKHDNGFLILFVMDQRKITFETGYGLEGVLPDALCKRIQVNEMVPRFKNEDYNGGILAGVEQVISEIRKEPMPDYSEESGNTRDGFADFISLIWNNISSYFLMYLIFSIVPWLLVKQSVKKTRARKDLSNVAKCIVIKQKKNSICVLLCIIGVVSALFIISYYGYIDDILLLVIMPLLPIPANLLGKKVMKEIKEEPVFCEKCEHLMRLLSAKEEKIYLLSPQILEEKLNSVLYDIYYCNNCKNTVVFKLDIKGKYTHCSKCNTKSFGKSKTVTAKKPTYQSTGLRIITYECLFCNYEEKKQEIIPRLEKSSGSSRSSSSSGWSSSSSSGGSFGGGRSSGGGATSGW